MLYIFFVYFYIVVHGDVLCDFITFHFKKKLINKNKNKCTQI